MMKNLEELQKKLKIRFRNEALLHTALMHRSYLNEHKTLPLPSNEKMEFLGDSVLSLITSVYLYTRYPHLQEGEYTDIKAAMVKTESLYEAASQLGLYHYIYLSKGESMDVVKKNKSILADCFEAIIAAIFLDQGFKKAYTFVTVCLFDKKLHRVVTHQLYLSPKNRLQEYAQTTQRSLPKYTILTQEGPAHEKKYTVGVFLKGKKTGEGIGPSKKEAEEKAAIDALRTLNISDILGH